MSQHDKGIQGRGRSGCFAIITAEVIAQATMPDKHCEEVEARYESEVERQSRGSTGHPVLLTATTPIASFLRSLDEEPKGAVYCFLNFF